MSPNNPHAVLGTPLSLNAGVSKSSLKATLGPGVPLGGGAVTSVFGRTGDVVAQAGDYSAFYVPVIRQIIAGTGLSGGGPLSADVTLSALPMIASGASHRAGMAPDPGATAGTTHFLREDATWAVLPSAPVSSVFGRTGAIVAANNDYTAAQVTNAVDQTGSYPNPAWITSYAWGKLTGVVSVLAGSGLSGGGALTANVTLSAVPMGASGGSHAAGIVPDPGSTVGSSKFLREDATWQLPPAAPVTSVFGRTGAVVAVSGDYTASQITVSPALYGGTNVQSALAAAQTPWVSDINGANFRLLSTGNVGIGNNLVTLEDANSANTHVITGPTAAGTAYGEVTACGNSTTNGAQIGGINFANYAIGVAEKRIATIGSLLDGSTNSGNILFSTSNSGTIAERMRITSAGNVGIGTTSPNSRLSITVGTLGNSAGNSLPISELNYTASNALFLRTTALRTSNATDWHNAATRMQFVVDASNMSYMDFNPDGSNGGLAFGYGSTEFVRVTTTGNVGIGTASPGAQLDLSTDSARKLSTTLWNTGSDLRIKQNVRNLEGGLSIINQLRPVECEHNGLGGTVAGIRTISLIAQEVQPILPGTVTVCRRKLRPDDQEEMDLLDFNPHEIIFHLILAVQQLSKERGN